MFRSWWPRNRKAKFSSARRRPKTRLQLENLETRCLLSGNVTIAALSPLTGVEGTTSSFAATFTDTAALPASQLTATIDYGDGSSLVTAGITQVGTTNQYTVADTHLFLEESGSASPPATFAVTLHVFENATPTVNTDTQTTTASVDDASLSIAAGTPASFSGVNTVANPNGAATALQAFETAIGGVNNGATPPPQATGFRTINWDGVKLDGTDFGGDTTVINPGNTVGIPINRFQERGVQFEQVYAVSGDGFTDVNPNVAGLFPAFSPKNTFAMFNENSIGLSFVLPSLHTTTPVSAGTRGFGAIFLNVTTDNTSSIEFFNGDTSLGKFFVPKSTTGQAEFLGELFSSPIVTRVSLTLGEGALFSFDGTTVRPGGADSLTNNLVVTDDFVYAEPTQATQLTPISSTLRGQVFTGTVANFTDSDPNANTRDFTATIDWGDGHRSAGTIVANGSGGFNVQGTNTFATTGRFTASVLVQDLGGSDITLKNTIIVSNPLQEVFVIGQDNQVYGQKVDANGNPAGGYFATSPGTVKAITVGRDASNNPLVFAIGLDNQVYEEKFDSSGNLASQFKLVAPGTVKSIQVGHDATNNPELFAQGLDNQVYAVKFDASGNTVGTFFLTSPGTVQSFSVGSDASGNPLVLAIGGDSQVYEEKFMANGSPNGSYFLVAAGQVKSLGVGHDASNKPILFVVGLDNQLYSHFLDSSGNPVGNYTLTAPGQFQSINVSSDGSGNPTVFGLGLDNQVYEQRFDGSGNAIGGMLLTTSGQVKSIAVSHDSNNNPEVFAIGQDNQVYIELFNALAFSNGSFKLASPGQVKEVSATS
jgi:hypothetical protein